jgi:very-short-patch-repair endonuclease
MLVPPHVAVRRRLKSVAGAAVAAAYMRLFAHEPERRLWRELAGGKLGVAFRRQVVLGNRYIADFVASAVRLVVEVDGGLHARPRGTAQLMRAGIGTSRGSAIICFVFRLARSCAISRHRRARAGGSGIPPALLVTSAGPHEPTSSSGNTREHADLWAPLPERRPISGGHRPNK